MPTDSNNEWQVHRQFEEHSTTAKIIKGEHK